jgi:hypothetical protein
MKLSPEPLGSVAFFLVAKKLFQNENNNGFFELFKELFFWKNIAIFLY